jgi:hypothetical protein
MPDESVLDGRDPWFDTLTTLSEVEQESSESDELLNSLSRGKHRAFWQYS